MERRSRSPTTVVRDGTLKRHLPLLDTTVSIHCCIFDSLHVLDGNNELTYESVGIEDQYKLDARGVSVEWANSGHY